MIEMSKIRFIDYLREYLDFNNISNKEFASRINISEKHLIDILSGQKSLSSSIIENISLVTDIPIDYIYKIELNYKFETSIEDYLKENNLTETQYLNKYNYNFLIKNNWIDFIDKTDKTEIIKDILKFLRVTSPEKVYDIRKNVLFKSKNDKPELQLIWLEKCYRISLEQNVSEYKHENIETLVKKIREFAHKNIFDEEELIRTFNEMGIALVIQEDIPGSKIRGAFVVHKNMPSIYITKKHKRIAEIYFSLLHELAHCKSDFNKAKSISFISLENEESDELKRDKQAFEWMVPEDYYKQIISDNNYNLENEKKYPKCFIAYRLANDKIISYSSKDYQKYNITIN